jgi:hypothetical protein
LLASRLTPIHPELGAAIGRAVAGSNLEQLQPRKLDEANFVSILKVTKWQGRWCDECAGSDSFDISPDHSPDQSSQLNGDSNLRISVNHSYSGADELSSHAQGIYE